MVNFHIVNKAQINIPALKFRLIKEATLGKTYDLNVIFTTPARIMKLNKIYRDINKPTDILSFPISKNEGEIYLCLNEARKEAKKFDRPFENFVLFLFIHGCVHLKGYDHSSTMNSIEKKFRKKFGV
jgi:probable rRNA maturation factor